MPPRPGPGVAPRPGEPRGPGRQRRDATRPVATCGGPAKRCATPSPPTRRTSAATGRLAWLELLSGNQAAARSTLGSRRRPHPRRAATCSRPWPTSGSNRGSSTGSPTPIRKLEARKDAGQRVSYLRGRMAHEAGASGRRPWPSWTPSGPRRSPNRSSCAQLNLLIAGCHERRGDREAQVESLKRVLAIDPNHLAARVALANAYLTAGRDRGLRSRSTNSPRRSPYAGRRRACHPAEPAHRIARLTDAPAQEWQAIAAHLSKAPDQHTRWPSNRSS